jgi:hypothetical protein
MPGIRIENQVKLRQGTIVIIAMSTNITYPGRKVWHCDHFIPDPGYEGDQFQAFMTRLALIAGLDHQVQ